MRNYTTRKREVNELDNITCDVCKTNYHCEKDIYEIQEFLNIEFKGGYDSIFGDGNNIECNICQHCVKKLLDKHLNITENAPF